ncbi:MAG: hypothetical protein Q9169_000229 [Polycauliona sp. 2 TL-2023]
MAHRPPNSATGGVYDDPSDEDWYEYDYGPVASTGRPRYRHARPATYPDGTPLYPPTVCHLSCRSLNHRIPGGGLPEGASLGLCHQLAVEEGICLTHVGGGCYDEGMCEELNKAVVVETGLQLGYRPRDFECERQQLRVAAGLSPGPPDDDARPGRGAQGGDSQQQFGSGSTGRDHHGISEGQRRRLREPEAFEEGPVSPIGRRPREPEDFEEEPIPSAGRRREAGGFRPASQGSLGDTIYPDEVEEPEETMTMTRTGYAGPNARSQGGKGHGIAPHAGMIGRNHDDPSRGPGNQRRGYGIQPPGQMMERRRAPNSMAGVGNTIGESSQSYGAHGPRDQGHDLVPRNYDFESARNRR